MPLARCDRCETVKPATTAQRMVFDVEVSYMMLCPECSKCYANNIKDHVLEPCLIERTKEFCLLMQEKIPYIHIIEAVHWVYDHEENLIDDEVEVAILYFKKKFPDIKHYRKVFKLCRRLSQIDLLCF